MKILDQSKKGTILNAIKSYNELAEDELAKLILPNGSSKDDYANYQVRRNGNGELLGVQAHDFTEAKSAEIEADSQKPDLMDALQVVYGHGVAQQRAVKKFADKGFSESMVRESIVHDNHDTLIDTYLSHFGLTRYSVSQKTGIQQSTLSKAALKNTAQGLSTKVISAIALAIGTDAGKVLNDLIMLEAAKGGYTMSDTAKFYFHGLYVGRLEQVDGKWMIYTSKEPNVDEDELDYGEDTKEDTAAAFQDELESRGRAFDDEEHLGGYHADEGFKILGWH